MFVVGIATWLGWWPQIIHEPLRTQRWVRIVPAALLLAAAVFTEELTFRGVALATFRRMHLTEAKVALYGSVIFGAVHLSNALATGSSAIVQAIVVSFTG